MAGRVLITGITGFVGGTLAQKYLDEGYEVFGNTFARDEPLPRDKAIHLQYCDIRNESQVEDLVRFSKPDLIFHMAAQPYPLESWLDPTNTIDTNVNGTIHLFSALMKEKLDPTIVVACSSAEYGMTVFNLNRPLKEEDPLLPVHPYGLSKVCQDILSYQYFTRYNMKILRARIFNTIGPGKKGDFVGDMSEQIARIKRGQQEPIVKVGNLTPKRDLTDVRDQASALISLANSGKIGEAYNVCSGNAIQIGEVLERMIKLSGIQIQVKVEQERVRPVDEPVITGDPTKIKKDCSWKQNYDIDTTLKDSIDFWN